MFRKVPERMNGRKGCKIPVMENAIHCSKCESFGVVAQVIGSGPRFKEIGDNPKGPNNPDHRDHPSDDDNDER